MSVMMLNIQLFGGRGGSSGMSGGSGGAGGGGGPAQADQPVMRSVNQQDVSNWMDTHNAFDYASNAPDVIEINNVEFAQMTHYTTLDSRGNTLYGTDYQATEQASNGEWPTVHISVQRYTRGRLTHYRFDRSASTGTRLT